MVLIVLLELQTARLLFKTEIAEINFSTVLGRSDGR